ncbi:MAG: isopropylmalate synthase [Oscillospiraceae bacterium]|nr:isopropylmalate synthase [Oscillospiraceae bacterium]
MRNIKSDTKEAVKVLHITDVSLAQKWAETLDIGTRNELYHLLLRVVDNAETQNAVNETIHIADARETAQIARCADGIRVIGLDTLISQDYAAVFSRLLSKSPNAELCPGNEFGCAAALAVEFVQSGGRRIAVSFMGLGGFAPTEEVLLALRVTIGYKPGLDLSVLAEISAAYERAGAGKAGERKPVIGRKIFNVESGIHVNGILKNAANYEPFSPETVGLRRRICLGKHSGRSAVVYKLKTLGKSADAESIGRLLQEVQAQSARLSRGITDTEFEGIVERIL